MIHMVEKFMLEQTKALEGLRILDFTHVFQGPVATQLLADYGADVIKVERQNSGDWSRVWGPFVEDVSMPFANLNRNKRMLSINLKHETGKSIMLELIKQSDVLVHNFRVGVMDKLGLGYEELKTINPRLIYATSSGWGDNGPYVERKRGGHDLMARAEAGWFYQADDNTRPAAAGISIDYAAGLMLANAIMMALFARSHTGEGQMVSTDLLSVAFHANVWDAAGELNQDKWSEKEGIGGSEAAIEKAFKTADGWIEISPVFSDNALRDISVAIGLDDLSKDERFETPHDQIKNRDTMNAILDEQFLKYTTAEWIEKLEPKGVFCADIRPFIKAANDPQIAENKMVIEMQHPTADKLKLIGNPARLHGTPPEFRIAPAALGEHNRDILQELGYQTDEILALEEKGVIGPRP
jgi:crotonobetainyl-CoA:carnitine CoA-transferase CaiB-like acyl-CoA transferase